MRRPAASPGKLRCTELASREIESGEPYAIPYGCDGGKKIVVLGVERRVGGCAGSDHARHLSSHKFFANRGSSTCSQTATLKPRRISLAM